MQKKAEQNGDMTQKIVVNDNRTNQSERERERDLIQSSQRQCRLTHFANGNQFVIMTNGLDVYHIVHLMCQTVKYLMR